MPKHYNPGLLLRHGAANIGLWSTLDVGLVVVARGCELRTTPLPELFQLPPCTARIYKAEHADRGRKGTRPQLTESIEHVNTHRINNTFVVCLRLAATTNHSHAIFG